jgi:hypothetical protein
MTGLLHPTVGLGALFFESGFTASRTNWHQFMGYYLQQSAIESLAVFGTCISKLGEEIAKMLAIPLQRYS